LSVRKKDHRIRNAAHSGIDLIAEHAHNRERLDHSCLFAVQALVSTMVNFVVKTHGNFPVASTMRTVFYEAAPNVD
jgi:hypothetical protein